MGSRPFLPELPCHVLQLPPNTSLQWTRLRRAGTSRLDSHRFGFTILLDSRRRATEPIREAATQTHLAMRASVFIATRLEGYVARQNGDLDWLSADGGVSHGEE